MAGGPSGNWQVKHLLILGYGANCVKKQEFIPDSFDFILFFGYDRREWEKAT